MFNKINADFEGLRLAAILPKDLKLKRGVLITFSLSTVDEKIAKIFEPKVPKPKEKLEILQKT